MYIKKMTTGLPDLNNLGVDGIKANLWANGTPSFLTDRKQLEDLSQSSDFLGFKYLVEKKIGKENSVAFINSLDFDICFVRNFQILRYIIEELEIDIFKILDTNLSNPTMFVFAYGEIETFNFYKKHYSIYNTEFVFYYFDTLLLVEGRGILNEDIDHFVYLLELFEIDLKELGFNYYKEFENSTVLDDILTQITPNRKLINLIIKQKAGFLLSGNRQNIKTIINGNYPSSGWLRSINH